MSAFDESRFGSDSAESYGAEDNRVRSVGPRAVMFYSNLSIFS